MREVVWSDDALDDPADVVSFLSTQSAQAARLMVDRINHAISVLADLPTGHLGRVEGVFEKVVQKTSYIVAYTKSDQSIFIVRVIHGARNWPKDSWPEDS